MKDQAAQKINKIGKIGYIIAMICRILLIIAAVGCLVIMIVTATVTPSGMITVRTSGDVEFNVDLSSLNVTLSPEEQNEINSAEVVYDTFSYIDPDNREYIMMEITSTEHTITARGKSDDGLFDVHSLSYLMIPVLITIISALVCIIFAGNLCKAFRDCETPFAENVIINLRRLAYSLIPWTLLNSFADGTMEHLLNGEIHLYFNLNIGMIVTVILVFMLVVVFKYGAVLQQESDETL